MGEIKYKFDYSYGVNSVRVSIIEDFKLTDLQEVIIV